MDVVENVKKVIQELILPEIGTIKEEYKVIKSVLDGTNQRIDSTNKRLDDINTHLVDQSRRIDETNKRIDYLRVELRDELLKTNVRMDRLYEVIVRREEHNVLEMRIVKVEQMIEGMKEELLKLAA
ncbi:hypothetical protein HY792_01265 [Candidatus Desantisbacteria bacterium]|nr:hypothetical protein [Candidatus Desantisbacteria bacterium]